MVNYSHICQTIVCTGQFCFPHVHVHKQFTFARHSAVCQMFLRFSHIHVCRTSRRWAVLWMLSHQMDVHTYHYTFARCSNKLQNIHQTIKYLPDIHLCTGCLLAWHSCTCWTFTLIYWTASSGEKDLYSGFGVFWTNCVMIIIWTG